MLKLARLALFALIVSGLNVQSTSACLWWNCNSYNACVSNSCFNPCRNPCFSPCYTPCQPMCNPCGYTTPAGAYPIQSGYKMNGPAWSNRVVMPQNTITNMPVPNMTVQGSTVPMTPQSMSPYQGSSLPQTWYASPQTVTPNSNAPKIKSDSNLPPSAEALESTRSDWQTIQSKGSAGQVAQQPSFKNVTLQKKLPSRRRSVRAPSAAAVWQHLNSAR